MSVHVDMMAAGYRYLTSTRNAQKTLPPKFLVLLQACLLR
jgi:hypothetical protein